MSLFGQRRATELLPCPFCGEKPSLHETFGRLVASCVNSRCSIRPSTWGPVEPTVSLVVIAKAWNQRPKGSGRAAWTVEVISTPEATTSEPAQQPETEPKLTTQTGASDAP